MCMRSVSSSGLPRQFGPPPEAPIGPTLLQVPGAPMVPVADVPLERDTEVPDMLEQAASKASMPALRKILAMMISVIKDPRA